MISKVNNKTFYIVIESDKATLIHTMSDKVNTCQIKSNLCNFNSAYLQNEKIIFNNVNEIDSELLNHSLSIIASGKEFNVIQHLKEIQEQKYIESVRCAILDILFMNLTINEIMFIGCIASQFEQSIWTDIYRGRKKLIQRRIETKVYADKKDNLVHYDDHIRYDTLPWKDQVH